jgi:hypothetical protein
MALKCLMCCLLNTLYLQEPCSGRGIGNTGDADQVRCDASKWAELHTDYIYTQDVKHNP